MLKRLLSAGIASLALVAAGATAAIAGPATDPTDTDIIVGKPPARTAADKPTVGVVAPKGRPTRAGFSANRGAGDQLLTGPYFFYNAGRQTITNTGAAAAFTIKNPTITAGDHSLAEIALGDANGNYVEIGWTKDPGVCGSGTPLCLFIFNWVGGVAGCYNGCGYVDYAPNTTTYAGVPLTAGVTKSFSVVYDTGAWWFNYDSQWLGYIPDSDWTGSGQTFTSSTSAEFFGEVAAPTNATPCTDMGDGTIPVASPLSGAYIASVTMPGIPSSSISLSVSEVPSGIASQYDAVALSARSFLYGGPGYC